MREKDILKTLRRIFVKDKSLVMPEIRKIVAERDTVWDILRELKRRTSQAIEGRENIFEEYIEGKESSSELIGDLSLKFGIVLNNGVTRGYDWYKKLADHCGGTVRICQLWASLILPLYTIDLFYMKYCKKHNYIEYGPYQLRYVYEKETLGMAKNVLKEQGLSYLGKNLSKRIVPSAVTDLKGKGEATVFDCLFSDVFSYTEERHRYSDKFLYTTEPSGAKFCWSQFFGKGHKASRQKIVQFFPSGDTLQTKLNAKGEISYVGVNRKKGLRTFELDIAQKIKQAEKKRKT